MGRPEDTGAEVITLITQGDPVSLNRKTGKIAPAAVGSDACGYLGLYPRTKTVSLFCLGGRERGILNWNKSAILRIDDEEFDILNAGLSIRLREFMCFRFCRIRSAERELKFHYVVSQMHLLADPMLEDIEDVLLMARSMHRDFLNARRVM